MASLKSDLTSGKEYENQLVDIVLDKGNIAVVHKKTDLISGKVLSIDSSHVELSGQQVYEMEKGAPVYRLYGEVGASDISHVMVGYDGASFAIEQGRVTAILLNERVMAKHIRVLINTTGYEAKFHQSVEVTSTKDYKVTIGDNETVYPAGQSYKVNKDDVLSGRITIEPSVGGLLELKSVERAYGNPSYHGTLEINSLPEGLVVVNELDVEPMVWRH